MALDHDHPHKLLSIHPELVADLLRLTLAELANEVDPTNLERRNI